MFTLWGIKKKRRRKIHKLEQTVKFRRVRLAPAVSATFLFFWVFVFFFTLQTETNVVVGQTRRWQPVEYL